jgi:hypothetical protein
MGEGMNMRNYRHIEVRPISGALGAEIHGVDMSRDLADDVVGEVRQALLDHLVIFLRDQKATPPQQLAFARKFGEPIEYPQLKGLPESPMITPVVKLEHDATISAVSGTPTRPICRCRRWAACCWHARCRPTAATPCSPTSTSPMRRCLTG